MLRDLTVDDDLDAYNVGNQRWPGAAFLRERGEAMSEGAMTMVGAETGGRPAAFLFLVAIPIRIGGRGFGGFFVQPWARGEGVGSALRTRLLELAAGFGLPGIVVTAPDDTDALQVVQHWGHPVVGRHYESALDLRTLDDSAIDTFTARVRASGIDLALLGTGKQAHEADLRTVYPFFADRFREAPDSDGSASTMPFDVFAGFISAPWRLLLARRADELIGLTGVSPLDDRALNTFFTGVHPGHRGQGIGLALKARHAQLLRDRGYEQIRTQNMDSNRAVLAANDRLGFERLHAYLDVAIDVR
ncbi:MAG: GNAT family N-acetyltransferase [Actinomycetota bacterium]|nr:GNAT family N-acetyltransferase [Actinomycetota bacterium]